MSLILNPKDKVFYLGKESIIKKRIKAKDGITYELEGGQVVGRGELLTEAPKKVSQRTKKKLIKEDTKATELEESTYKKEE